MARINQAARSTPVFTHGGAPASLHVTPYQQLRRSVLSCMLWENTFYESGQSIANRISALCTQVTMPQLLALAVEARTEHNLRHAPLLLLVNALHKPEHNSKAVGDTIAQVLQRADEPGELLALYWAQNPERGPNKRASVAKQLKRGLAAAMQKFDAYQLAKYNRKTDVKLTDILRITHAKPDTEQRAAIWKQLFDGTLASPDTWEVALSGGADKRATFERLLQEGNLGYLALLRNLRNMVDAGVDTDLIKTAILARKGANRVLPFRFVAAARACPQLEPVLDQALVEVINVSPPLLGKTLILVDVSGSMRDRISAKSDISRMDAAATLASMINSTDLRVVSFSYHGVEVPPRRGMAGVDAIIKSQPHDGTALAEIVSWANTQPHDRLIVITDEQATTGRVPDPVAKLAYMINVASYQNGVGYGKWTQLNGFSESVLKWINAVEQENAQ